MKRRHLSAILLSTAVSLVLSTAVYAQQMRLLAHYDETNGPLEGHATQILQDAKGMFWIATWNGLCRFDGYEFVQMKPQAGDGCSMQTDRLRKIWLAADGDIFCQTDDGTYRFDTDTYHFRDLADETEQEEADSMYQYGENRGRSIGKTIEFIDRQGLCWLLNDNGLFCYSLTDAPGTMLSQEQTAQVRCMVKDSKGRLWVTTREDGTVRLFDEHEHLLGYLGHDGRLSAHYQSFGNAVYSICETRNGDIWLGCKPSELHRLRETNDQHFAIDHLPAAGEGVYSLAEDHYGRLWIGTLGAGIGCMETPAASSPILTMKPANYPNDVCQRVRQVFFSASGTLLVATTEGLLIGEIGRNLKNGRFHRHQKDFFRPNSLSCNATMNIVETPDGRLFVSTETGGFCEILSTDLMADTLSFRHYDYHGGQLPSDMTISVNYRNGQLVIVGNTQLTLYDLQRETSEYFDHHFFQRTLHFSEAYPLFIDDNHCYFGTHDGAIRLESTQLHKSGYQPKLVLTGIAIQRGALNLAVDRLDTLQLSPSERSLTIHFAALDYADPKAVQYQFRMGTDTASWNHIGHDHSVTLLDLKPGTYQLYLRSTNADGQWVDNTRSLTIIALPTFWETPWATLLIIAIIVAIATIVIYTLLYIRRIKHQRQETLEAYLALLEKGQTQDSAGQTVADYTVQSASAVSTDDPFLQKVLAFVEQNLGNSDADVGQMADACAVSRSVLQRRMKQLMGVSPADFLREARLKRACQLLKNSHTGVSDVAYQCGFSDPKYFSRCFRQSVGMSPSEYKNQPS